MEALKVDTVLQAALEYAGYGWRIVPLKGPRSKHPVLEEWQKKATTDEEKIVSWWDELPGRNCGVVLGQSSGIIDVESDSAEADKIFAELFGDETPATPTYMASRGNHRLFRWRADLPEPTKNGFKIGTLEFRTGNGDKGAQSVVPPSKHPDGPVYKWLIPPSECEVAEFPDEVLARLWNWMGEDPLLRNGEHEAKPQEYWDKIFDGVVKDNRNVSATEFVGILLHDTKDPFNADAIKRLWLVTKNWNDRNKPPLDERELASSFKSILRRHQSQRTAKQFEPTYSERTSDATKEIIIPDWRLVIVEAKPRVYRLYSPLWSLKAPNGYIELNSSQMQNPAAIRIQALEQADVWVSGTFDSEWRGGKDKESLAKQVVRCATFEPAPIYRKRDLVILELLWNELRRAKTVEEGKDPPIDGRPWKDEKGTIYFGFNEVWAPMARFDDRVKRNELGDVLEMIQIRIAWKRVKGQQFRLQKLDRDGQKRVITLLGENQESPNESVSAIQSQNAVFLGEKHVLPN